MERLNRMTHSTTAQGDRDLASEIEILARPEVDPALAAQVEIEFPIGGPQWIASNFDGLIGAQVNTLPQIIANLYVIQPTLKDGPICLGRVTKVYLPDIETPTNMFVRTECFAPDAPDLFVNLDPNIAGVIVV